MGKTARSLNHRGIVTPYGDTDLGQPSRRHQAISWTIVSKVQWYLFEGGFILWNILVSIMNLKITYQKFHKNLLGGKRVKYTRMLTQVITDNEMIGFYETSTFSETDPS